MSVSSHLSPDPEKRLLVIHEMASASSRRGELKLWALAFFAALELAPLYGGPLGGAGLAAVLLLGAAAAVCLAGVSPFAEPEGYSRFLDGPPRPGAGESLLSMRDLAGSPHRELVFRMDSALGGGITATKYYEDIVARIIVKARLAVRKERFFTIACALALAAQPLLLLRLSFR